MYPQATKKPAYKKPQSVKQLEEMANQAARDKFPGTPAHYLAPRLYRDDTANALTKCIVDYIRFCGGFSSRLNSTGSYRADLHRFVFSNQIKGMSDIQAIYNGKPLFIEVKIGRDKLSPQQIKFRDSIILSGGLYFIAGNFSEFKTWFDNLSHE
jgi:hypothetical protein